MRDAALPRPNRFFRRERAERRGSCARVRRCPRVRRTPIAKGNLPMPEIVGMVRRRRIRNAFCLANENWQFARPFQFASRGVVMIRLPFARQVSGWQASLSTSILLARKALSRHAGAKGRGDGSARFPVRGRRSSRIADPWIRSLPLGLRGRRAPLQRCRGGSARRVSPWNWRMADSVRIRESFRCIAAGEFGNVRPGSRLRPNWPAYPMNGGERNGAGSRPVSAGVGGEEDRERRFVLFALSEKLRADVKIENESGKFSRLPSLADVNSTLFGYGNLPGWGQPAFRHPCLVTLFRADPALALR